VICRRSALCRDKTPQRLLPNSWDIRTLCKNLIMKIEFNIAPNFIVPDVVASAAYYRDRQGFTLAVADGDPPNFVIMQGL
jgi:hypothetical protein